MLCDIMSVFIEGLAGNTSWMSEGQKGDGKLGVEKRHFSPRNIIRFFIAVRG